MPSAISVAVLPDSPHAREMATKAHNSGHEVLIHLPMAPLSKQPLEKNTLRPEMSSDEIERIIRSAVNNVPYAVGINNHMGSKMTLTCLVCRSDAGAGALQSLLSRQRNHR